ncbi:hypothetical protein JMJ35_003949 [Cladonia borealis]|uniref:TPR repeat-containing protein n=1 Tax=Cladonia borealis TaxID=184061 RepID=A0AA39V8T4_9LECA|nr:hypothetical protein JMJ35_003949 [Cladonia borealis]
MNQELLKECSGEIPRSILGHQNDPSRLSSITVDSCDGDWMQYLTNRIDVTVQDSENASEIRSGLFRLGRVALDAFLQANVTGPPFAWESTTLFPEDIVKKSELGRFKKLLVSNLSVDGEAVYQLMPHVEIFCLARCLLNHPALGQDTEQILARLRVNFWHQRLLSEISSSLQERIYEDLRIIDHRVLVERSQAGVISPAEFLIERATIHIYHGFDAKARNDLAGAARERSFDFALTGRLGKRTKFQEKELSQLVVLARSATLGETSNALTVINASTPDATSAAQLKPAKLNLDDDTLLESIAFTKNSDSTSELQSDEHLPKTLSDLDPGNQPQLEPLDAITLLATASSITNTSPTDGLTREETLPYAERVLSGGSSNWQIYTQALLVRSRIECYKSRTIERGVLQLQALVDQVIAETASIDSAETSASERSTPTTFLPKINRSDSAPASERLRYIHALASPPRWKLEAELADRWVSLGGLRTALEIYERLQMWAEVALCWAANDREDKARKIIRSQLYNPVITTSTEKLLEDDEDTDVGDYRIERVPLPADAPRLFCILGDIEKSVSAYERAWTVSNFRYARAQRSLGKFYSAAGDLHKADAAYSMSLKVNPQNHAIWFALGCVRLQLEDWAGALEAFSRSVQIDGEDAESWSNLAVALLRLPPEVPASNISKVANNGDIGNGDEHVKDKEDEMLQSVPAADPQRHIRGAFVALKRAVRLKRESFRIWQNLLSVAVQLVPPPYTDIIIAQTRLIDLLGKTEGERCVDVEIVEGLVSHLIATSPSGHGQAHSARDNQETVKSKDENEIPSSQRIGFEKMVIDLVQKKITPLITSSRRLWLVVAKLSLHLRHPAAALSAYEKAWRVTLNKPGWDTGAGTESATITWAEVSEATIDLVDGYESLGERTREAGMAAGELVAKDWKFKARSALRSVMSRAKEGWEGDAGNEILSERLQDLKSA